MSAILNRFNKESFVFKFLQGVKLVYKSNFTAYSGKEKKYPKVVQLPITYKCNSKCVMCNIWKMDYSNELTIKEFAEMLKDPVFSKVEHLGINGGEPSLIKNLDEYVDEILKLPKLKTLNIITHGFNKKLLWKQLETIYQKCKSKEKLFHVSVSLDGYGKMHDIVRGLPVFKLTSQTIEEIQNNPNKYCDSFDVGCTITKQNVDYLVELDAYAKEKDFDIKYRMGIENKRIESNKLTEQYSLFYDGSIQSAKEFMHSRYEQAGDLWERFKYFSIFDFLSSKQPKRKLGCYWQTEGITVDSRGDMYYCAVASEKIGSLRGNIGKGLDVFWDADNLNYRQSILEKDCNNCIHDYYGKPLFSNITGFLKQQFSEKYYWLGYYVKSKFS